MKKAYIIPCTMVQVVATELMLAASTFQKGGGTQSIDFLDEEHVGDFDVKSNPFEGSLFDD